MQGTLPSTPSYSSSYSSDASSSSSDGSSSAVQRRTANATTEAVGNSTTTTTTTTNRGRKRAHDIIPVINKPIPPFPATAEHTIVSRTSIVRLSDCVIAEVCGVDPPTSPSWQYLSRDAIIVNRNRLYPNPQVGPPPTYIIRCAGSANRDAGFYRIGPIQLPFCTSYYKFSVSVPRTALASGKSATLDAARAKPAIPILSGGIQLNEGTVPLQQRCPSMQSLLDIVLVAFPTHSSEIRAFMNCADFFTRQPIGGVVSALQRAAAQVGNVGEHEELFSRAMAAIEQSEPTHKLSKLVISDIRLLHVILLANATQVAEFPRHLWEMCVWACREYLIGRDFFELAPYVGAWGLFDRPSSYISAYLETLREACTTSLTGASTLMWYFVRNDAPSFIDANHLLAYVHGNISRDNPSVLLDKLLSHTGGVTTAKFLGEEAHAVGSLRRPDNNKRICVAFDRAREVYRATFGNNFYEYGNPFGGESHFLLNDLGIVKPCAQPFQSPFRVFCCTDPQPPGPPAAATRAGLFVAQRAVDSAKDCIDNYLRLLIQPYAYAQSRIVRIMEMLARVAWQTMVDYSRRTAAAASNRKQKQQQHPLQLNSLINPGFLLAWEKEMQASFFGTDAYSIISPLLGKLCEFARAELMEAGDIPRAQLSVLQAITNIILSLLTATPDIQFVEAAMVAYSLIDAAFLRERVATILQTTDLDTQQEIHARVGLNRISESKPLQEVVDILGGRPIVLLDVNYCATERTDQGVRYTGNQNSFDNLPSTLCLKAEYIISRDMLDELELYMLGDKTVPLDGGPYNLCMKPQKNKDQPIQIVLMEFHKWSLSDLKRLLAIFFWDIHYNQVQNPQPMAAPAAAAPELVSSKSAWQCTLEAFQSIYSLVCVGDSSALDAGALSYLMSWLKEGAFMLGRDFIYVRGHQHHTLGKSGMSVLATNCYRIKCNGSAAVDTAASLSDDSVIQVDGLLLKPPGLAIAAVCESIYDALGHPQTTRDIPIRINVRNIRSLRQLYTLFCYAKRCVIESSTGVQLNHIAELLPELRDIFDRASADGDFVLVQDPNSSLIRFANQYPIQHRYLLDMTSVANEAEMASSVLAYQPTAHTRCLWDEMLLYT